MDKFNKYFTSILHSSLTNKKKLGTQDDILDLSHMLGLTF